MWAVKGGVRCPLFIIQSFFPLLPCPSLAWLDTTTKWCEVALATKLEICFFLWRKHNKIQIYKMATLLWVTAVILRGVYIYTLFFPSIHHLYCHFVVVLNSSLWAENDKTFPNRRHTSSLCFISIYIEPLLYWYWFKLSHDIIDIYQP